MRRRYLGRSLSELKKIYFVRKLTLFTTQSICLLNLYVLLKPELNIYINIFLYSEEINPANKLDTNIKQF